MRSRDRTVQPEPLLNTSIESNKTISRELGRRSHYCAESVYRLALQRGRGALKHSKLDFTMQVQIDHQLKMQVLNKSLGESG
ncbi:hypothetical protein [Microbulbifer sp. JMSA002]|uniref:hypothetical protein n=1 Tax=Microbulbifer sp. JMSA002 TaxID=3243368 RepID=UPI00403903B9